MSLLLKVIWQRAGLKPLYVCKYFYEIESDSQGTSPEIPVTSTSIAAGGVTLLLAWRAAWRRWSSCRALYRLRSMRSLVAGELGKSVRFVRVPDEGPSKRGSFTGPHRPHLLSLGEGLLVFPLVEYHGR